MRTNIRFPAVMTLLNIIPLLLVSSLFKGSTADRCVTAHSQFKECPQSEAVVKIGQSLTLTCSVNVEVVACVWINPKKENVRPLPDDQNYRPGSGDKRDCHLKIMEAREEDNGEWSCSPLTKGVSQPKTVSGRVVVAVAYSAPVLSYQRQFKDGKKGDTDENPIALITLENKELTVSCKVPNARPAAKIKWYLQNENRQRVRELTDEARIREPTTSASQPTLMDSYSTIKRVFKDSDNGKRLECVAKHIAVETGKNSTAAILDVRYPPKFLDYHDRVIHVEGNRKSGKFTFKANPSPNPGTDVQLRIDEKDIATPTPAGAKQGFSVKFKKVSGPGNDRYEVRVTLKEMTPKIEKTKLVLHVENEVGSTKLNLRFTSAARSSGSGLTTGVIIGIAVAVLLIITILVVVFVVTRRRKEDPADEQAIDKEGSDVDGATDPKNKTISARINQIYTNLVKPKKGKEDDPEKANKEESVPLEEKPLDKPESPKKEGEEDNLKKEENATEKKDEDKPGDKNVVYAELDLKEGGSPPKKNSDETTEYAEIVGTVKGE